VVAGEIGKVADEGGSPADFGVGCAGGGGGDSSWVRWGAGGVVVVGCWRHSSSFLCANSSFLREFLFLLAVLFFVFFSFLFCVALSLLPLDFFTSCMYKNSNVGNSGI